MESNGSKKVLEETTISQINMGLFGESDKTEKPFRTRRTPLENGLIVIRKADEAVRLGPLAARPKDVRIDRSFIQTALRLLARRLFLRDVLQTPDRAG